MVITGVEALYSTRYHLRLAGDTILLTNRSGMARWRKQLFAFLARNNVRATAFFNIPPNRVLELRAQVEL